ncbi:2-isopropylmalate synthase [Schaalia sp. ZJ405]|uniref:2-isopropylmalate synthase n=1 Tax=unclassified Schaalia TaxID=2691889 RepID=UPI0013EE156D|nr:MULTISPECIES: 2-isopropylmalate synthase [unclassified Schaalia]QPK80708.1 2-isopropylmalate synthase [Schaalia sp. ZJ405]
MKTTSQVPQAHDSGMPIAKYRAFLDTNPVDLPDRQWPSKRITHAPRWMSTDLRDGNQALIEPMDPVRKRKMFDLLVGLGYKEIEIGFPAASQTDFDFVRSLVEDNAVPEDVTISVLTQSRPEIIERTVEALVGFPRATVHLYNATAPVFRDIVFGADRAATVDLAVAGTREVIAQAEKRLNEDTIFGFEYSPEIFVDTELDFALEICEAVMDIWQPDDDREIILNLPSTVERATPNVYADQIEFMSRNLSRREHIAISVHPHNDRGTGVASAELAILAGADRVEGCLLGQGERTGNVDLVTLGLNLFSQGIDPGIDFSNVDDIRRTVEYCTNMETSPRAPYVGDLVYTSFSGSHQDAIKKGFSARKKRVAAAGGNEDAVIWELPYLPIDPHDVGRSYEAVVRVNSQSGKGGVAYLMSTSHNLELPRRLQVEFSRIVQRHTDTYGGEINADLLWKIFADEYLPNDLVADLPAWGRFALGSSRVSTQTSGEVELDAVITDSGQDVSIHSHGSGPLDAFVVALHEFDIDVRVLDYSEHAMSQGREAKAAAYVEAAIEGKIVWGVGIDSSITSASYKAVISAVNRALR